MRFFLTALLVFCWTTKALAADEEAVEYEVGFLPKLDLTYRAHLSLRYRYTKALSSRIAFLNERYKLEDKVEGVDDSELEETTTETILDLYPLEYATNILHERLRSLFGASFNLLRQQTSETATFDFQGTQASKNQYGVTFLSGKIELQNSYKGDRFAFSHHVEYVPLYFFSFDQRMSITPLVPSGEKRNRYSDTCQPFLKNDLRINLGFFELSGIHEFQRIRFSLLNLTPADNGGYALVPKSSTFSIHSLILLINIRIPVHNTVDVIVGAGVKVEKTKDLATGSHARDRTQVLFNLGSSDALFD